MRESDYRQTVTRLRKLDDGQTPHGDLMPGRDQETELTARVDRLDSGKILVTVPYSDDGGVPVLSTSGGPFGADRVRFDGQVFEVETTEVWHPKVIHAWCRRLI